ncbi:hypothetical protein V8F20_007896 [Naviculisporaceae sp. PSN 640]
MDSTSSHNSSSLCLSLSTLTDSSSNNRAPQKKLKEACDLCSTFKLRCDKGKPACGRCVNLNQQCSYSPARRAGRPHRLRQLQQQKQQQQPPHQREHQHENEHHQQLETLLNGSVGLDSGQPLSFAAGDFDWGNYDWGMELEASSDETTSSSAIPVTTSYPQVPAQLTTLSSAPFTQPTSFTKPRKSRRPAQMPATSYATEPKNHTTQRPETRHRSSFGSTSSSHGASSEARLTTTVSHQNHGDCFQIATTIVEQLDPTSSKSSPSRSSSGGPTSTSISTYCQRLLTILVCPCSEQPVVALLVASACLGMVDNMLQFSQQQQRGQQSDNSTPPPPFSTSSESSTTSLNEYLQFHYMSPSAPVQCEFEGLAKIAKVVLRFTQRYAHYEGPAGELHGAPATRALLEPIVSVLRSKLQCVTEEATGKLVL